MKLELCQHPWEQLAACFATVTKSTLEDVFQFCGHNGSHEGWPQLPEPYNHVGFHAQEMFSYCHSKGYWCTPYCFRWITSREGCEEVWVKTLDYCEQRFNALMRYNYGVINTDRGHLVWDGKYFMDPILNRSFEYTGDVECFTFYVIGKMI